MSIVFKYINHNIRCFKTNCLGSQLSNIKSIIIYYQINNTN